MKRKRKLVLLLTASSMSAPEYYMAIFDDGSVVSFNEDQKVDEIEEVKFHIEPLQDQIKPVQKTITRLERRNHKP